MSSSMMRGLPHNNSTLNLSSRRDNLIIEIDDSNDDSDDNTLQIVEEAIDESIQIDDSTPDEPVAIVSYSLLLFFIVSSLLYRYWKFIILSINIHSSFFPQKRTDKIVLYNIVFLSLFIPAQRNNVIIPND